MERLGLTSIDRSVQAPFWHSRKGICSDVLSGIYSDILSEILSGILSDILSNILPGLLSGMGSGPGGSHSIQGWRCGVRVQVAPTASWAGNLGFGFRRPPQHPGLAMWGSGPGALHCILGSGWQKEKAEVEQREEGEGRREGGKEGRKAGRSCTFVKIKRPSPRRQGKMGCLSKRNDFTNIMGTFTKQIGFDSQNWGC